MHLTGAVARSTESAPACGRLPTPTPRCTPRRSFRSSSKRALATCCRRRCGGGRGSGSTDTCGQSAPEPDVGYLFSPAIRPDCARAFTRLGLICASNALRSDSAFQATSLRFATRMSCNLALTCCSTSSGAPGDPRINSSMEAGCDTREVVELPNEHAETVFATSIRRAKSTCLSGGESGNRTATAARMSLK